MSKDTIYRQDAITAVKIGAFSAATIYGRTDKGSTALHETVRAIKALPPAEPQWISCSERLPNSQTEVIVSCRDDSADTIYRYTASGWITTNDEYWIVDNEINPYVVAWMPLPEPYRGEKDD